VFGPDRPPNLSPSPTTGCTHLGTSAVIQSIVDAQRDCKLKELTRGEVRAVLSPLVDKLNLADQPFETLLNHSELGKFSNLSLAPQLRPHGVHTGRILSIEPGVPIWELVGLVVCHFMGNTIQRGENWCSAGPIARFH
jgi:hypothetical protein